MKRLTCQFVLVLAVCSLLPVVANAQNAVERPFRMTAHSQLVITLSPDCTPASPYFPMGCSYVAHAEGVASHMGEVTGDEEGIFLPTTSGVMTAANGDQVTYDFYAVSGLMVITGGTGRFEGASGEVTLVIAPDGGPIVDGVTFTQKYTWKGKGTITY